MYSAKTIFKSALLVGTLDITAAFIQVAIQSGKSPFKPVLSFVASGLFGKDNHLSEGARMAAGLLVHYCIATTFTIFFFLTVARLAFTRTYPVVAGILYGMFIWAVMNLLLLPATNTRPFKFDPAKNGIAMGILIVCIGIPLALIAHRKQAMKLQLA